MRTTILIGTMLLSLAASTPALAWDGPGLWYDDAAGANPGGGGIIGTGSARDYNVTCVNCHGETYSSLDVRFDFTPPLPEVGGQPTYDPGQTYQVAVTLLNETLGISNCDQYMMRTNNFAATFEDASGKLAGVLGSDQGQTSTNCPQDLPPQGVGTTFLYRDCKAIISTGAEDMTSWGFSWTAPAAGAGQITLYYGAVDGNCDMSSKGDAARVGTIKIGEATAAAAPRTGGATGGRLAALLGLLPLGLAVAIHRRRRGG